MNKAASYQQSPSRSIIYASCFLLSWVYWFYLACTTQMLIVQDAAGYESLGKLLLQNGWIEYFRQGLNREPMYPWLISKAMRVAQAGGFSYQTVQVLFQMGILGISQLGLFYILRRLKIRPGIVAFIVLCFGFSPAGLNAATSLYSEIVCYPLVFMIIFWAWSCAKIFDRTSILRSALYGGILGTVLFFLAMAKGAAEAAAPIFLIGLTAWLLFNDCRGRLSSAKRVFSMMGTAFLIFYIFIFGYKFMNSRLSGSFALTNRAALALYGNTARRVDSKALKMIPAALASIPGPEFCQPLVGNNEDCHFWSALHSDEIMEQLGAPPEELQLAGLKGDRYSLWLTKRLIVGHPFSYLLFWSMEGLKMLFWDSVNMGFVVYPQWIITLYQIPVVQYGLPFLSALAALVGLGYALLFLRSGKDQERKDLVAVLLFLWLGWVSVHCFFFILPRYVLPLAPLYLILLACALDQLLPRKHS